MKKGMHIGWSGWRQMSRVMCEIRIAARLRVKVYRKVVRSAIM